MKNSCGVILNINKDFFAMEIHSASCKGKGFFTTEFHGKGTRKHTEKTHKFCARQRAQNWCSLNNDAKTKYVLCSGTTVKWL